MDEILLRAEYLLGSYQLDHMTIEESTHRTHWIIEGVARRPGKIGEVSFSLNVIPPINWEAWQVAARAQVEMLFRHEDDAHRVLLD